MIEPGAFNGLAALTTLDLGFNSLPSLPAGTFDGLVDIETMYAHVRMRLSSHSYHMTRAFPCSKLEGNGLLVSVDVDVFAGLTKLKTMYV